ncbi:MAG: UbiD family decarboxylase [Chromatiales bacterium]|nr:MAG: UbiD family decarboxylase [Chromatiales bacterium]
MHDFRSFVRLLEERGGLDRIAREVDPRFEQAAVMQKLDQARRAFLFEQVQGAAYPAVGGLLNTLPRFGLALQQENPEDFGDAEFDALLEAAKASPIDPVETTQAVSQEVVIEGDAVDLATLPVPTFFELDTGPFITAAIGITRHPENGIYNVGVYRTLIIGKNRCVINASSMSDLRRHYAAWEATGDPMPIALAIGADPSMLTAAACKLPPNVPEFGVGGALKGAPVELAKCKTNDLLVPASAEFIIEGTVDFSEKVENLLGEFAGQYGPETAPATTVTAITHRRDPLFHTIMAGRNPEHNTLGSVAVYGVQRSIEASLRPVLPQLKQIHVYLEPGLGTLAHVVLSIDKQNDAEPRQIIDEAFKAGGHIFPVSKITKRIIVVDDDIDVHKMDDVQWAIWNRAAAANKFMVIPDVESWELERAAKAGQLSARIGIDATMDLEDVDKLVRPITPGATDLRLEDYLGTKPGKQSVA